MSWPTDVWADHPLRALALAWLALAAWGAHARTPITLEGLGGLRVDATEVTIAQFRRYAQATGVVTATEREGGGFEYQGGWQRRSGWHWQRPEGTPPPVMTCPPST